MDRQDTRKVSGHEVYGRKEENGECYDSYFWHREKEEEREREREAIKRGHPIFNDNKHFIHCPSSSPSFMADHITEEHCWQWAKKGSLTGVKERTELKSGTDEEEDDK